MKNKGLSASIMDDCIMKKRTVLFCTALCLLCTLNAPGESRTIENGPSPSRQNRSFSGERIHFVRKGETLYSISRRYEVSPDEIRRLNSIQGTALFAGMRLRIPGEPSSFSRKPRTYEAAYGEGSPVFRWPVKKIKSCSRDGSDGVKAIGIVITSDEKSTVCSSAPGIVEKIGRMRGFGTYVVIRHASRYTTVYSLLGNIQVVEGDCIDGGRVIGHVLDRQLHFQIDRAGRPLNPLDHLP